MKTIKILMTAAIAMLLLSLASCKKDSDSASTPKEIKLNMLTATSWKLQGLKIDGVDHTNLYAGMTLSFTAGQYTTTDGLPVWPASGTWEFSNEDASNILRDGLVNVSIEELADKKLVLSFAWDKTTYGEGRSCSVSGKHIYTFTR